MTTRRRKPPSPAEEVVPAEAAAPAAEAPAPVAEAAPAEPVAPAAEAVPAEPAAAAVPAEPAPAAAPAEPAPAAAAPTTDIVAGPGGVMTDEVGVVTGDLTVRTELSGSDVVVRVQYKDADEWYVITGTRTTLRDPSDIDALHTVVVGILNRPEG